MSYDHTREIIRRIYAKHGAGCCWHVVLDDYNWHLVGHCRERARTSPDCVTEGACQELAALDVSSSHIRRALKAEEAAPRYPEDASRKDCEGISKLVAEGKLQTAPNPHGGSWFGIVEDEPKEKE